MATPEKNKKAQTFIVDVELGPKIQMLLAKSRLSKNGAKYTSISDFVNQAIHTALKSEK